MGVEVLLHLDALGQGTEGARTDTSPQQLPGQAVSG